MVSMAKKQKANIAFEKLNDIRKTAKVSRNFRYFLNSWQFYTLQSFVEYKSMIEGIKTVYVDPKYTSQMCSNCKKINKCESKKYICSNCKLHIHRDENASYNIANRGKQALSAVSTTGQRARPDSNLEQAKVKFKKKVQQNKSKRKLKSGSSSKSRTPRLKKQSVIHFVFRSHKQKSNDFRL
jgi:IS605 OrfB family transposase